MTYLEIKDINKKFDGKTVLNNIHLTVDKGSFVSLLGQSGCGKTTLLRIITGLENSDNGSIVLDRKNITTLPVQLRNIGIVFQNYALFPHMSVFENIAYGLKIKKINTLEIRHKVDEVLEKVNLSTKNKQNVSLLSGGEQQRVAFARAIVTEPQILLLDEPLSNLDHSLRIEARNELKRLQHEIGITCIYVTHDQSEALALSDVIAVMDKGNMVQTGSPKQIYNYPNNIFTAGFVGHYNLFDTAQAHTYFGYNVPQGSVLAILPENLMVHKIADGGGRMTVKHILFTGALTEYVLSNGEHLLKSTALTQPCCCLQQGDSVSLSVCHGKSILIPL